MANDDHLTILRNGGMVWNNWRRSLPNFQPDLADADLTDTNLRGANLTDAYLIGANLAGANLRNANLTGADLRAANLRAANLRSANLSVADLMDADLRNAKLKNAYLIRANLAGANLTDTNLSGADLSGANLTRASLGDANFMGAKVNSKTQGLEELSDDQRDGLVNAYQDPDAVAQSAAPSRAAQITVGTAQHIIGRAHEVLIGLSIPNDLSEAHRDLFRELLRTVEDLQHILAGFYDETRLLSHEPEELRKKLDDALPLWKRAWETFVLKSAEGAGTSVGKGAVFTAGFIAGATYREFAAEQPGIPV